MNKPPSRLHTKSQLSQRHYDLLVIGGGIVGSGIARDAAQRGLRTALVDRHDFAFGTSSRSSRLLHGGLRYLEQGRVGLVREASLEKKILRDIAPHLGNPLGFVFPSYKKNGRPLWQLRIGVKLYDLLCNGKNFAPSRGLTSEETMAQVPGLDRDGLRGSVRYFDALTNDARLVIDTMRSAVHHGATVANYTRFLEAKKRPDGWNCKLVDELAGESFNLRASTIVNATGPWAEGIEHSAVQLRLSKGIHIVIDRARLPLEHALVVTEGKRILFVLPWGKRLIIGTTDTDYEGAPENVSVDATDISYVLRTINIAFPALALTESDIISSWAGLRPLVSNPDGSPSDISREHQISCPEPAWWDVTGGKLTTYRLMAEQTVDQIARTTGCLIGPCRTAREPLLPTDELTFSGILPAPCTLAAVEHFVDHEWATSLTDVMVRRSGWHYYHGNTGKLADTVATWMGDLLGWTPGQRAQELAKYQRTTEPAPPSQLV